MGYFLKLLAQSWRDLWRNKRRTILTGLVMVFSVAMMIPFIGLGDGAHAQMIRGATESFLGQVQVQHKGFHEDPDLFHRMEAEQLQELYPLLKDADGVTGWAPRVTAGGLASKKQPAPLDPDDLDAYKGMTSEGSLLVGVDPVMEKAVSNLADSLVDDDPQGRCLRGCKASMAELYVADDHCEAACEGTEGGFAGESCDKIAKGACQGRCPDDDEFCDEADCLDRFAFYCEPARFLADSDPYADEPHRGEVVLGSGLAQLLDAGVGDRVAVTTGTARQRGFGSIYKVVGLVKTMSLDINRTFALTHLDKLSTGLEIPGAATMVVISVDDLDGASDISAGIGKTLEGQLPGLAALSWRELSPELDVFVKIDQGSLLVMLVLMVMIVGVILANVVTMSVMERTKEYGVRLAMGESPNRITLSLVLETLLLAFLSGGIGAVIGEALNVYYETRGIDFGMGDFETTGVVLSTVYHTEVTMYGLLFSVGTVVGLALVGALYPAFRIRRVRPVDALRFV